MRRNWRSFFLEDVGVDVLHADLRLEDEVRDVGHDLVALRLLFALVGRFYDFALGVRNDVALDEFVGFYSGKDLLDFALLSLPFRLFVVYYLYGKGYGHSQGF